MATCLLLEPPSVHVKTAGGCNLLYVGACTPEGVCSISTVSDLFFPAVKVFYLLGAPEDLFIPCAHKHGRPVHGKGPLLGHQYKRHSFSGRREPQAARPDYHLQFGLNEHLSETRIYSMQIYIEAQVCCLYILVL